jgi:5-methylcytosine-specific restriction enzyme B
MSKNKLYSDGRIITLEKSNEFIKLFKEFISSYPYSQLGLRHQKLYHEQRKKGKENFQAIEEAFESGEDINEKVLLQLLPYLISCTWKFECQFLDSVASLSAVRYVVKEVTLLNEEI